MKPFAILFSIVVTFGAFIFYMFGLMNLEPLSISSFVFFISLMVTFRLIFQRKKKAS